MQYQYLEQVYLDFALMSNNARIFNLDESPIYHDSEGIRQEFFKRTLSIRKPYLKNYPYLESFPSLPLAGYNVYTKFVVLLQDDEDANDISESFEEPFVKPAKKKSKLSFDDGDAMTVPHESYSNSSSSSKRKSSSSSGDRSDHRIVEMEPVLKLSLSLKRPVTATTSSAATTSTGSGRKSSKRKFENE
jgi:hypothetical protein